MLDNKFKGSQVNLGISYVIASLSQTSQFYIGNKATYICCVVVKHTLQNLVSLPSLSARTGQIVNKQTIAAHNQQMALVLFVCSNLISSGRGACRLGGELGSTPSFQHLVVCILTCIIFNLHEVVINFSKRDGLHKEFSCVS